MQPVLTVAEMREVDRRAVESGTPLSLLVERAGTAVAVEAVRLLGGTYGRRVVVVAGPGNNGADGRVAARLLDRRGTRVLVVDALDAPERLPKSDLVIDAAFGTGFRDSYDAPDTAGAAVLAVDVPTGVDADTGEVRGKVAPATATVTFGAMKPGLLFSGEAVTGTVIVAPVGLEIPPLESCAIRLVEDHDIVDLVPERVRDSHKWKTAVAVVAGSPGMYGAAFFVARAAARSGAGMVRLRIPGANPSDLPVSEAVSRALPSSSFADEALEGLDRCHAIVVGPGLGTDRPTRESVRRIVSNAPIPVVVDADGLFALGEGQSVCDVVAPRHQATVQTPHDGEFARLTGSPPPPDRIGAVRALSARTGAVVLLKGPVTVVAEPTGRVLMVTAGSSRLATAGTGDVLSGVIGAFIARGMRALEAAGVGAHTHGRAAMVGPADGLIAGDLADGIAFVLSGAAAERHS